MGSGKGTSESNRAMKKLKYCKLLVYAFPVSLATKSLGLARG